LAKRPRYAGERSKSPPRRATRGGPMAVMQATLWRLAMDVKATSAESGPHDRHPPSAPPRLPRPARPAAARAAPADPPPPRGRPLALRALDRPDDRGLDRRLAVGRVPPRRDGPRAVRLRRDDDRHRRPRAPRLDPAAPDAGTGHRRQR